MKIKAKKEIKKNIELTISINILFTALCIFFSLTFNILQILSGNHLLVIK